MRYRGGGIGHKATWDWNDTLQYEGHGAEEVEEADEGDSDIDVGEDDSEEGDIWDDEDDGNNENGNNDDGNGEDGNGEDGNDEGDEDRVLADEGEELDDDILAEEGYGAL